jgi:hypothetical protein
MTTAEYYSIDIEDLPGIKLFEKHTHTHTHTSKSELICIG